MPCTRAVGGSRCEGGYGARLRVPPLSAEPSTKCEATPTSVTTSSPRSLRARGRSILPPYGRYLSIDPIYN